MVSNLGRFLFQCGPALAQDMVIVRRERVDVVIAVVVGSGVPYKIAGSGGCCTKSAIGANAAPIANYARSMMAVDRDG